MEAWENVPLIVARSGACLPFLLCLHHSLRSALTDRMTGVPLLIYLMQCFEVPSVCRGNHSLWLAWLPCLKTTERELLQCLSLVVMPLSRLGA